MNDLQVFNNPEFGQVRTVVINNEPFFIAKDISNILGYSDAEAMFRRIDEEDQTLVTGQNLQNVGFEIPSRGLKAINESGLYAAVLSSKLPTAKKFKHWVTSEVLPSIRKHGAYATDDVIDNILKNPDFGIKLLTELKQEREEKKALEFANKQKDQLIGELKPKADYVDKILKNTGLVTITQIAKDYGMSGEKMNSLLHELGVQYKQSGQWLLYTKYQDKGYTHSQTVDITRSDGRPDIKMNTKWTQKGRLFLYDLLKVNGLLPVIERKEEQAS